VLANVFIAETCADMSVFHPRAVGVVAGLIPGSDESAGRVRSAITRPGNRHLKAALGIAVLSASRSPNTYYGARYRRVAGRRPSRDTSTFRRQSLAGQIVVALEHKNSDAWHMLVHGTAYHDPGPDYYTRHRPATGKARAVKQLQARGSDVTLEPHTDAA
jgi:hypothetical protein